MPQLPENLQDFFYWVRHRTESISGGSVKWIPLTEEQIDTVEARYGVSFMPEHRLFLKILHTIDKKDGQPFFYNWLQEEDEIRSRLDWPYRTILQDVLGPNAVWLRSWGRRPSSDEEKENIFAQWLRNAPRLVPLRSHRFLVSDHSLSDRPVLSVYGSDIVVYGWDLRLYLLNELHSELDLRGRLYDEADQYLSASFSEAPHRDIPFWKEMILIWTSGWSSFGLQSPLDDGEAIQEIRKTYSPDGHDDEQKQFMGHE